MVKLDILFDNVMSCNNLIKDKNVIAYGQKNNIHFWFFKFFNDYIYHYKYQSGMIILFKNYITRIITKIYTINIMTISQTYYTDILILAYVKIFY